MGFDPFFVRIFHEIRGRKREPGSRRSEPVVDVSGNKGHPFEAINLLQHMDTAPITSQRVSQ